MAHITGTYQQMYYVLDAPPVFTRWYADTLQYDESELGFGPDTEDSIVIWKSVDGAGATPHPHAERPIIITKPLWKAGLACHWGIEINGLVRHPFFWKPQVLGFWEVLIATIRESSPQSNSPLAAWPRSRNALEYEPWPQILNEPKSLYQLLSGTSGFDSIQTRS